MKQLKLLCTIVGLGLWLTSAEAQFYNGSDISFGKNRIQYNYQRDWSFFRYEWFDIYFYQGGQSSAIYAGEMANQFLQSLSAWMEYTPELRLQIILYNKLSDLRENNIGIDESNISAAAGTSVVMGQKILIYQHEGRDALNQQLKQNLSKAFFTEYLFGKDLKLRMQNAMLFHLPHWYLHGLSNFASAFWTHEWEEHMQFLLKSGNIRKFHRLQGEDLVVAATGFWFFVSEVYGYKMVVNLIEVTRIFKNMNQALEYVFGASLKVFLQEYFLFFEKRYKDMPAKINSDGQIIFKSKRGAHPVQFAQFGDEHLLAYSTNRQGKLKIWVQSAGRARQKIYARQSRSESITDYSYPLLAGIPGKNQLMIADEWQGRIRLGIYDYTKNLTEWKFLTTVEKLVSIDVHPNGRSLLITALDKGISKVGILDYFTLKVSWITTDESDKTAARFSSSGRWLAYEYIYRAKEAEFVSLPRKSICILPFPTREDLTLEFPIASYSFARLPIPAEDSNAFYFINQSKGYSELVSLQIDSSIVAVDTIIHYRYLIKTEAKGAWPFLFQQLATAPAGFIAIYHRGATRYMESLNKPSTEDKPPKFTPWWQEQNEAQTFLFSAKPPAGIQSAKEKRKIDLNHYRFYNEPADTVNAGRKNASRAEIGNMKRIYETNYFPEIFTGGLGRQFLNQNYQPFNPAGYVNPGFNGLFRLSIADVFENHKLSLSSRLGAGLVGNEYLLSYKRLDKRHDEEFSLHRLAIPAGSPSISRTYVHTLRYQRDYILSENMRLGGTAAHRFDRKVFMSTDAQNLQRDANEAHWLHIKGEWTADYTYTRNGTEFEGLRAKAWVESFKQWGRSKHHSFIMGFDARTYYRVHREMHLAARLASSYSFGPRTLIHYLGGVDQWLTPRFSNQTAIDFNQPYIFQALGTPLRGFEQNARNGDKMLVFNGEWRLPVFRYFSKFPVNSHFLNHFEWVVFFDAGTAFTGTNPYSISNTFNQQKFVSGPITITLFNLREPIIYGYGTGIRLKLLGYRFRLDLARGVDSGVKQRPIFYLSLGNDF